MFGSSPPEAWQNKYPLLPGDNIRLAMNCLFIDTGTKKILIDPGMSPDFSPDGYEMEYAIPIAEQLINYGIHPEEITEVILTHLHFDHCAGIFQYRDNIPFAPAFPSACLVISLEQYKNIQNPDPVENDSFITDFLYFAEKYYSLKIISKSKGVIIDNITFMKYSGHSPGMIIPIISMAGKTLVFTTDLIPMSLNAKLKVVSTYDLDMEKSQAEMTEFLEVSTEKGYEFFLYHEPGE